MSELRFSAVLAAFVLIVTLSSTPCAAIFCYNCIVPYGQPCGTQSVIECAQGDGCAMLELITPEGNYMSKHCIFPTTCIELQAETQQNQSKKKLVEQIKKAMNSTVKYDVENAKVRKCEICYEDKCNSKDYLATGRKVHRSGASSARISQLVVAALAAISLLISE